MLYGTFPGFCVGLGASSIVGDNGTIMCGLACNFLARVSDTFVEKKTEGTRFYVNDRKVIPVIHAKENLSKLFIIFFLLNNLNFLLSQRPQR